MSEKTWSNQPDKVIEYHVVGTVWIRRKKDEFLCEIRVNPDSNQVLLTFGNLFNSDTVQLPNANAALNFMGMLGNKTLDQNNLPFGAEVIPNA